MQECYYCGNISNVRDVTEKNIEYVDGKMDKSHDEYCVRCGTLLYGEIKRQK